MTKIWPKYVKLTHLNVVSHTSKRGNGAKRLSLPPAEESLSFGTNTIFFGWEMTKIQAKHWKMMQSNANSHASKRGNGSEKHYTIPTWDLKLVPMPIVFLTAEFVVEWSYLLNKCANSHPFGVGTVSKGWFSHMYHLYTATDNDTEVHLIFTSLDMQ